MGGGGGEGEGSTRVKVHESSVKRVREKVVLKTEEPVFVTEFADVMHGFRQRKTEKVSFLVLRKCWVYTGLFFRQFLNFKFRLGVKN